MLALPKKTKQRAEKIADRKFTLWLLLVPAIKIRRRLRKKKSKFLLKKKVYSRIV